MTIDPAVFLNTARVFIPIIVAEEDLKTALEKHSDKVTGGLAGVGAVGAALAAPAVYASSQGVLWGIGATLGLVSAPAWVPFAGATAGLLTVGAGGKLWIDSINQDKRRTAVRVGFHLCSLVAARRPNAQLSNDLASLLNQYKLTEQEKAEIKASTPALVGEVGVHGLEDEFRRQNLKAFGQFCFKAGWDQDLDELFHQVAERLDLLSAEEAIKEHCRKAFEQQVNLIEGMYLTCAHLMHRVELDGVTPFLSALGNIHPQQDRLQATFKVGDVVARTSAFVATVAGYPAAGQVINQAWNGIRGVAGNSERSVDKGFEELARFAGRELGMKASKLEEHRSVIDREFSDAKQRGQRS